MLLKALRKSPQALIECRRVIPKRRMSCIRYDVNLSMGQASLMLIDGAPLHNCIRSALRDQDGLADPGQKIVVVERASNAWRT